MEIKRKRQSQEKNLRTRSLETVPSLECGQKRRPILYLYHQDKKSRYGDRFYGSAPFKFKRERDGTTSDFKHDQTPSQINPTAVSHWILKVSVSLPGIT